MYDYGLMKGPGMDLKKFVEDNFNMPPAPPQLNYIQQEKSAAAHIKNLWGTLRRERDSTPASEANASSLLSLPHPYIVPGGRFREIYYWDSYFTMLGLKESGESAMIENMLDNFAFLINTYGHIPNGNRSYYISRSQPPFFCMMVDLLAGIKGAAKGKAVYKKYLPAMQKEYAFWMNGSAKLKRGEAAEYAVKTAAGIVMNRYWDASPTPRQESYKEDVETADLAAQNLAMVIKVASPEALKKILDQKKAEVYTHLRAGACSGWDFSSRWFAEASKIETIQTTHFIPVDLNCLMYSMETIIAKALRLNGNIAVSKSFTKKAAVRKAGILKYCWNAEKGFFFDYNFESNSQAEVMSAAAVYPLFVKIATPAQAAAVAKTLTENLLKDGGVVSTSNATGQQWDAPNGWAPQQWAAVTGFSNYNNTALAKTIATRWLALNDKVYAATGKMMEKYNVADIHLEAGGGEYPSQDGFGWTNGVYLAFKKLYEGR